MSGDSGDPTVAEILRLLCGIARGDNPSAGRDEVAGPMRIATGGMRGRALHCVATPIDGRPGARRLCAGDGEIEVRMAAKGELIFAHGDLVINAGDRVHGAAFVDAMAAWLGTPLDRARSIADNTAVSPVSGRYVKLGVRDDADGVRWDALKLFIEGDEPAEVFLRVTDGAAAFTEKWSAYRECLLTRFDACLGVGRGVARRSNVAIPGGAWLTVPSDWIVRAEPGHVAMNDATDEASLEVSCQPFPLDPRMPGLRERLEAALRPLPDRERAEALTRAVQIDRGDLELVWTDHAYEATDTKTGKKRPARMRTLIAANDALQALATYAYWPDDASWSIPEWETIMTTLRLASHPAGIDVGGGATRDP